MLTLALTPWPSTDQYNLTHTYTHLHIDLLTFIHTHTCTDPQTMTSADWLGPCNQPHTCYLTFLSSSQSLTDLSTFYFCRHTPKTHKQVEASLCKLFFSLAKKHKLQHVVLYSINTATLNILEHFLNLNISSQTKWNKVFKSKVSHN